MTDKLTLLIDGPNLAFRCFHAYETFHLITGESTSVTFGFFRVLESIILEHKPISVVICWDGGKPEFRKRLLPTYKANRKKEPWLEDVYRQMDAVRRVLPSCGVVEVFVKGAEADDLMYHASKIIDGPCLVVTTDKDLLQAVTPDGRVKVLNPQVKKVLDWAAISDFTGLPPRMLLDYRILTGDSSDNIPGVPGIGEKLARDVLEHYPLAELAVVAAHTQETWEASNRALRPLKKVTLQDIEALRRVMDLSVDQIGAVDAVKAGIARWMKFDLRTVSRFFQTQGFSSLLVGVKGAYSGLVAPTLGVPEEEMTRIQLR